MILYKKYRTIAVSILENILNSNLNLPPTKKVVADG